MIAAHTTGWFWVLALPVIQVLEGCLWTQLRELTELVCPRNRRLTQDLGRAVPNRSPDVKSPAGVNSSAWGQEECPSGS